jgi:hypothetical protein
MKESPGPVSGMTSLFYRVSYGDWEVLPNALLGIMRWLQFDGQLKCLRLWGKVTSPGGSEYRCLFSVVPVGGASPAVNPGDFTGQGAA